MNEYSDQAERMMKRAAAQEEVPGNLNDGIMRAIRTSKEDNAVPWFIGWHVRVAAAVAVVALVAGVCFVRMTREQGEISNTTDAIMGIGLISDANPVALLSTRTVEDEMMLVASDLERATDFCLTKLGNWSRAFSPES